MAGVATGGTAIAQGWEQGLLGRECDLVTSCPMTASCMWRACSPTSLTKCCG